MRGHLFGERAAGRRALSATDPLEPFLGYLGQRLADDPHV